MFTIDLPSRLLQNSSLLPVCGEWCSSSPIPAVAPFPGLYMPWLHRNRSLGGPLRSLPSTLYRAISWNVDCIVEIVWNHKWHVGTWKKLTLRVIKEMQTRKKNLIVITRDGKGLARPALFCTAAGSINWNGWSKVGFDNMDNIMPRSTKSFFMDLF